VNRITSCENAQQVAIALGHKDGADASVAHMAAGRSYRRARGKRERILVPDDVRYVSHYQAPCWRSAFLLKFYLDHDGMN
jgi:hypothetical protein